MKLPFIALAAVAAALLSTPAHAQPSVVTSQFTEVASGLAERGFVPVADVVRGTLAQGADTEFELELEGNDYVVMGFCDGGCTDLDLVLTDGSGSEVAADRAADDYPVLTLESKSGTFVLSVLMATCGNSECHYGVQLFRKQ
ncbi:MAG TPA: hypothetical protein VFT45_24150 [Longimicrobium sp.]|nr:hypothetical protein [Longimicrobium sp.]